MATQTKERPASKTKQETPIETFNFGKHETGRNRSVDEHINPNSNKDSKYRMSSESKVKENYTPFGSYQLHVSSSASFVASYFPMYNTKHNNKL